MLATKPALLWLLLLSQPTFAAVDGLLDEAEWQSAAKIEDFRATEPLTRDPDPDGAVFRYYTDEKGIHAAFVVKQRAPARKNRTARDNAGDNDRVNVTIDFNGDGKTAYQFAVTRAGTLIDGISSDPEITSFDWDAAWQAAVTDQGEGYTVEYLIPWSVAPMKTVAGKERTVAMYVTHKVEGEGRRYAFPANAGDNPQFVALMHKVVIGNYAVSSLNIYPYISANQDFLADKRTYRVGADIFWKPNGTTQLTATVNPDFGQVEADDLVVNFTAVENFFSDRRPFFTENQSLFDLPTPDEGQLIYTRRIGAPSDAGEATDILGAAKLSGSLGEYDYGMFIAMEDDTQQTQGRDFAVLRARKRFEQGSVGFMTNYVDRETRGRTGRVTAFDFDRSLGQGFSVRGQYILSRVEQSPNAFNQQRSLDQRGQGSWLRVDYAPGGNFAQKVYFSHYDSQFNINDLGILPRNNINDLYSRSYWFKREYPKESTLQNREDRLFVRARYNDDGLRLPLIVFASRYWQFKDSGNAVVYAQVKTSGFDDLLTRGLNAFKQPVRYLGGVERYSAPLGAEGKWRWYGSVGFFQDGVKGYVPESYQELTYNVTPNFTVAPAVYANRSPDWLVWNGGNQVTSYRRVQVNPSFNLNAFQNKHELRVKFQWIALKATGQQVYEVQPNGVLAEKTSLPQAPDSFALSNLALQVRYRYQISSQADFFMVYSRGGDTFRDNDDLGVGGLFRAAHQTVIADQFLLKLRMPI
jgi:hypothetical protein